jgi:hypothetical protein
MNRKQKKLRSLIRDHARMAKMLLPPTPRNCPPYTKVYFESFRPQLFNACKDRRHRHCPVTSHQGANHLYCNCPCHRKDLPRHQRSKLIKEVQDGVVAKAVKLLKQKRGTATTPRVRTAGGTSKRFRYKKEPKEKLPNGIMFRVHLAISTLKEGTVQDVAAEAVKDGLANATSQDPVVQTSIMLHRLVKMGVVEIIA